MPFAFVAFIMAVLLAKTEAYVITVDAHAEECFFDRIEAGTKVGELNAEHAMPRESCNYVDH